MWCDVMCSKHPFCISRIMHLFAVRFSAEFVWRSPCMEKWWGLSYIIYEYHRTSLVLCYREFHLKMYDALVGFFVSLHSSYLWRADRVSLNFTKYFLTKAFSNNACVEQMWKNVNMNENANHTDGWQVRMWFESILSSSCNMTWPRTKCFAILCFRHTIFCYLFFSYLIVISNYYYLCGYDHWMFKV